MIQFTAESDKRVILSQVSIRPLGLVTDVNDPCSTVKCQVNFVNS